MTYELSLLVCTVPQRREMFEKLKTFTTGLIGTWFPGKVEFIYDDDPNKTIGKKRNDLLADAWGRYIAFIDDDDMITKDYFFQIFSAMCDTPNADCCSLKGIITTNGEDPQIFEHSIKYREYKTNEQGDIKYERYPNHLNVIKTSIAKKFKFPEINHGEDTDWATQIFKSGLLKTEATINKPIYHYLFRTIKSEFK